MGGIGSRRITRWGNAPLQFGDPQPFRIELQLQGRDLHGLLSDLVTEYPQEGVYVEVH